jgi:hypothetical protein
MLQVLRVAAFRKFMLAGRRSIRIPTGKSRPEGMASQKFEFELLSRSHDAKLPLLFGGVRLVACSTWASTSSHLCFSTSHELAPLFCFLLTEAISASCQSNGNSSSQSSYNTALCLSRMNALHPLPIQWHLPIKLLSYSSTQRSV